MMFMSELLLDGHVRHLEAKDKWKLLQPVTYAKRPHDMRRRLASKNMPKIVVYDPNKVSFPWEHRSQPSPALHTAPLPSDSQFTAVKNHQQNYVPPLTPA